jgi:ABC-2 type transport system permease protein
MKKIIAIALWEYLEKVRNKIFLVSLLLTPLVMLSLGILPVVLSGDGEEEESQVIGVADLTGGLFPRFAARLTEMNRRGSGLPRCFIRPITIEFPADEKAVRAEGDHLVLNGEIDGFCLLKGPLQGRYAVEYRTTGIARFPGAGDLEEVLRSLLVDDLLVAVGASPSDIDWLRSAVAVDMVVVSPQGGQTREYRPDEFFRVFFSAYIFLMMLFFMILSSGQLLVRSVVEEKANRIVEILVSACSPTELMTGKMLGLTGLGLTQMVVWTGIAILFSVIFSIPVRVHEHLVLLLVYFILGYLLYASIFVALGSPVTTEQEAQHITGYLVIVLVIPLVLTVPAIQQPGAGWIVALSYIPLLTPTMMGLRIILGTALPGEIILTVLLLLLSIAVSLFVAGRIFRIAILSTGKSPTFREVVSWIRVSG